MSLISFDLFSLEEKPKRKIKPIQINEAGIYTIQYTTLPNLWSISPYIDDLTLLPLQLAIRKAVEEDRAMFLPIAGAKGLGKSTLAGWLAYNYYKDWEKVKENFVFTLDQFINLIQNKNDAS